MLVNEQAKNKRRGISMKWRALLTTALLSALTLVLASPMGWAQDAGEKTFASPQDAGKALSEAIRSEDKSAILVVLGQSASPIINSGDEVQDKNNVEFFLKRYDQMHRWGVDTNGEQTMYIGADNWPLPVPLKKNAAGQWYFDSKAGAEEVLFRRIGKNELAAIRVCDVLVKAQQEYFDQTHDGDTVHQYAQKFISDEGKQNGLYWKTAEGQPESPIGPLVAFATGKGYGGQHDSPQPFYGYFYLPLTAQGPHAQGGAKSFLVDGKMTGGYAFVAYPAEYRNSGVMTFLVDQNGVVYQKDLGPTTADVVKQMTTYNPDKTWMTADDPDEEESAASSK
jgi:hypothetical protein